ncbi:MAG: response regulator [Gemmatimonadetes bacterium]|nr:MAG: response regulator [Gemmatimonadota bacterium]
MTPQMNTRILAVDDEDAILQVYRDVLGVGESAADSIMARRRARQSGAGGHVNTLQYEVLLAKSGEEAVQIVKDQVSQGNYIAAGFFDMKMPGGMDGLETIQIVKKLQPAMLVAVVTAYTDRTVEQIGSYFVSQDEWIYFNKPFTQGELKQAALHLVTSWNKRRDNRQAMKAIRQTVSILKKSRQQAEELIQTLPNETHLQLLERWSQRD